ncbi:MAG: 6-phospho 3-hexuloisomerase [Candidatus Methanoperedens nitroreducens]|uniref:6-phospho 3-hexuloisomerase n=1 Tax=Candidatus Methanoperedens nitratireducens TaxID=1392998 RepID=A0A0N8KQQ8_9EURY|nr:6-phospho-3-hexuloisomerase [Candidatus Methanoperedens sp. BLZ2]KAB2947529.1 MAG: 6-phospho-3-hexuloisomerase [Candidatus Methanoperedens sp.]KPQ42818.1 MAG: 6-phospho 3-hexuloisomerase [Candidatus Methanoperedens sp. BLZ1]MBZ0173710.1 6-phospho-3-hexuloisomerase [Candidatus Methanoperedens nitroreducens]CAG0962678.1 6-phospho-3-hexuloisomerase [Methanosarcinales archaeon]MCX9078772.1 6-phospho-3-hexuloisomerase [Candidatus Methanoperedens sp.]
MKSEKKECEATIVSMNLIADHIKKVASKLDTCSVTSLVNGIMDSKRIFLMGAGRSGLAARAFAMRLMHLGFIVYFVGETTTPAVQPDDLVIAVSGSGETPSIANLGGISKKIGSKLAVITSNKDSTLGKISDIVVIVPGRPKEDIVYEDYHERRMIGYPQLAPLGTIFEISALVFLDAVVSELMVRTGASEAELKKRHTVFE